MLFGNAFSWRLVMINIIIYVILQVVRIWLDAVIPQRFFQPERSLYRSRPWEEDGEIYQRLFNIKTWKDKLPTVNSLNQFSKKSLDSLQPGYLQQFIFETCRGESHHIRSILTTFIFILWNPLPLFLVILVLSTFGHLPFIMIQRYNRPRLQKILARVTDAPARASNHADNPPQSGM